MPMSFSQPIDVASFSDLWPIDALNGSTDNSLFIDGVAPLGQAKPNYLSFCSSAVLPDAFNAKNAVVFIGRDVSIPDLLAASNVFVKVDNPRLQFIKLTNEILAFLDEVDGNDAIETVVFGDNCRVKEGAVLGLGGFGFERDEQGRPLRFPHFGRVVLGDEVEIGANTVVSRGALSDTTIGAYTKIDDLVYIAHNCQIGERVMIAGGAKICGGVTVDEDAWIGAGACIKQNIQIGAGAVIGMGAVVIRDVPAFATVAGNPALILEQSKSESESERKEKPIKEPEIEPPHNQRPKGSKACAG